MTTRQAPIEFYGHNNLRQHIVLSIYSGRTIIVKEIRSLDTNPGLKPYEVDLLNLVQKVTNGTEVNINKTGTRLILKPGIVDSAEGSLIEHNCDLERSVTYYLECICLLGIFGKQNLSMVLNGNTDDSIDQSIDSFKSSMIFLLNQFGASNTLDISVKKRGYSPLGGGVVKVTQMYANKLEAISLIDEGKVKKIRGLVTSAKVSP